MRADGQGALGREGAVIEVYYYCCYKRQGDRDMHPRKGGESAKYNTFFLLLCSIRVRRDERLDLRCRTCLGLDLDILYINITTLL